MALSIERRLKLVSRVSDLMLTGSIHVYGTSHAMRITLPKNLRKKRAA